MAFGNFSGIAKVEYDTAGNSFAAAVDLGEPLADSGGPTFEPQEVETGKGRMLYAGVKDEAVFNITDMSKYSALETIMQNDTAIDVRITDNDGNTESILDVLAKVKKMLASAVGGRNHFEFKVSGFRTS